jgi:hypothetical protein
MKAKAKIKAPLFAKEGGRPNPAQELSQRPTPSHQEIADCARALWEHRGRPEGEDTDIWLEAEQKLQGGLHISSADDEHFANKESPLTNDGDPSGDIEERLRSFGAPSERSATSL